MDAIASVLLPASLMVPAALALACLSARLRVRMAAYLGLAPAPAVLAALLGAGAAPVRLGGMTLALNLPGAMLLGVASLLWIAAGISAASWLRDQPNAGRFVVCWLLTLTGSLGVFMAADLAGFYLVFALVSIPAYGLIVHDGSDRARRAGAVNLGFTILGETFLLMGFVLLAAATPGHSLLIRDVMQALPLSPFRDAAVALLIAGFAVKIGLVPLHVWMPLTYAAAPFPAAAVLSGAAVKAGVIGLIQFLPLGTALPGWGTALAVVGLVSAFAGVAVGVTQSSPKVVLAYSSISQMGLIAATLGMGLRHGDGDASLAVGFYGATHLLAKGALFLGVGVIAATPTAHRRTMLLVAGVLALGLGGLPLTGGALAKLATKGVLGHGSVAALASLSAAGSTLLMIHFLRRCAAMAPRTATSRAESGLVWPWLAMAGASVVVPWLLYPLAAKGPWWEPLTPASLGDGAWPVALGAVLAFGLLRWGSRLPAIPPGDLVEAGGSARRVMVVCGDAMAQAEAKLRLWPVAGIALLAIVVALGAAMLAGR